MGPSFQALAPAAGGAHETRERERAGSRAAAGAMRLIRAAALGLLIAALGVAVGLSPPGLDLEEALGLRVLFALRGPRVPPPQVLVASIDRESAVALDLPSNPLKWPRTVHAELTDRLAVGGAAAIVFDVFFQDPGRTPEEDARFAQAIRRAGTVVLARHVARETLAVGGPAPAAQANIERLLAPLPLLAEAAAGTAPFLLPKVPARVSQFWTFKAGAGDAATLPAVALHLFARDAHAELVSRLERTAAGAARRLPPDGAALLAGRHLERTVALIRELAQGSAGPGEAPGAGAARHLDALVRLYRAPDSLYLDFYGPTGTVPTIPLHRFLDRPDGSRVGPLPEVRGKAVFVGVSGHPRLEQKDDFLTVFSDASGRDLSGVEIAATAFANLLEGRHVRPLGAGAAAALLAIGGLALGAACQTLAPLGALAATLAAGAGYLALAHHRFAADGTWLPLVVPLLVQAPLALGGGMLWQYAGTNRERRAIRQAFAYYLPDPVIDQLLTSRAAVGSSRHLVSGTCLYTDAERYTTLAESLRPEALAEHMNRYYATVFEPVRRRGGLISDIAGDSALAIWAAAGADIDRRASACAAACEIDQAVGRFNREHPGLQLVTRIGLHAGELVLGHVGAMDHYEYRAVGDIVNTAARLEGLNKRLGTRVLASEEVLAGIDEFLTRCLGSFVLPGKSRPVVAYELVCPRRDARPEQVGRCEHFARALAAYRAQAWAEAAAAFAAVIEHHGDDGPSRFYLEVCGRCRDRAPDPAWDPVLRVEAK
jgi:adenylate cyclase